MSYENAVHAYYSQQAGSGLVGFHGSKFQRGSGIWSNLWRGAILPGIKWLGKRSLGAAANIASDVIDGANIKDSLKTQLNEEGKNMVRVAKKRAQRFVMKGTGKRRRVGRPKKAQVGGRKRRTKKRRPNKRKKVVAMF